MSSATLPQALVSRDLPRRVFAAGALVALLDLGYAAVVWVVVLRQLTLVQLAQAIAAGLLGRAAYAGGAATAGLGLALHCLIAFGWTLVFVLLVRRSPWLARVVRDRRGAVRVGLAYGAFVWLAMTLVVLPLSRASAPAVFTWLYLINLVQHGLMIGLPIALLVRDGRSA